MQSFPQPLSVEEENDYLERLEQGDRVARNVLIERNLRLVAYLVKKYSNSDHSVEDLISIGTIGLIKAIDTYKQGKGVRLATYASRCVENELLMMLRSDKKKSKEVFLYDPIGSDDGEGNHIHLLDVLETVDEDVTDRLELEDRVSKINEYLRVYLKPREQEIIRKRYGLDGNNEVTQREIAKELGISRSYVSRIEKRALLKLRRAYDGKE